MLILYVDLEWSRRWYVLAGVACRANKLIGVDTCLATFRGAIRTLNSNVSDPNLCLLWSAMGFQLSVRDPISASRCDPRSLISCDVRVGPRLYRGRVSLRRAWLGIYLSAVEELRGAFDDILRSGKGFSPGT